MVDADPRADALAESRTGVGPAAPTIAWVKHKAGAWFSFDIRRNEAWMGADIDEFAARTQNTEALGDGPLWRVRLRAGVIAPSVLHHARIRGADAPLPTLGGERSVQGHG